MKKLLLLVCVALITGLVACSKDKENATPQNTTIQIRVVNATLLPLSNVVVASETYGSLASNQASTYRTFTGVIYAAPVISFNNNGDTVENAIGICGTPAPPLLQKGRYAYTITRDASAALGFDFTFTKE